MSVGEAKARLLEFGHRPRGPKAAIRRDPLFAAAAAFFFGMIVTRFRPRPLFPLGLLLSPAVMKRVVPPLVNLAMTRFGPKVADMAAARAAAAAHPGAGRTGAARTYPASGTPGFGAPGVGRRPGAGSDPRTSATEWARGPQGRREGNGGAGRV